MSTRRDVILGGGCMVASGAAYALSPHRHVSLLGNRRLDSVVPRKFDGWTSRDVSDLVAPKEDSLASRLYGETVGRVYSNDSAVQIMMLLAHGGTQNDDLQLHRPEICYPFFGYAITRDVAIQLPVAPGVVLPCRSLVAEAPDRRETIVYWTRLGEYLPLDRKQQQFDRLQTAIHGEIADGLLSRLSVGGGDPDVAAGAIQAFIPQLIRAVAPANRAVLIGTERAAKLNAAVA